MNSMRIAIAALVLLNLTAAAYAEPVADSGSSEAVGKGIPIERLIAAVAKKTGKKFVVDPRVRANVDLVGQDATNVSYNELLTILSTYDFIATESGGYVLVLPDANARQIAQPLLSGKATYADAEIVNVIITVKNVPAPYLVPILRPLIPQYGHLAALICVNKLILVDRYSNVRRLEAIIEALDVGEPYKPEKCEYSASTSK